MRCAYIKHPFYLCHIYFHVYSNEDGQRHDKVLYTSLFTKMVVKRRKKIHTYKNIQQTETEAEIKNYYSFNIH